MFSAGVDGQPESVQSGGALSTQLPISIVQLLLKAVIELAPVVGKKIKSKPMAIGT
jgi:hypothetical protein